MTAPTNLRDIIEIAEWLEAQSVTAAHAKNRKGAKALWDAARLLRARNEQDDTQPVVFVCPNCSHVFGAEPDED
jgi:hypothetical protein